MNTINNSLFDVIETLDTSAKIPALRAIVHSSMAKCIGEIRRHLRYEARQQRNEELNEGLDARNEQDEAERSIDEINEAMRFEQRTKPLDNAQTLHAVYDWAKVYLGTLSQSTWDTPLTIDQMLDFMLKNAETPSEHFLTAIAITLNTSTQIVKQMHEVQNLQEREELAASYDTIVAIFNGFGQNGYSGADIELPIVAQHQLGVRLVQALHITKERVLARILRMKRLTELAAIPFLNIGIKNISEWVQRFEERNRQILREAIDMGRNIRSLEDALPL